ncbi:hepatoma-derived growth factor-like [Artemia franciscana]|uniref:PWWP domain-containing protein n=1 Tax=Artemia franciscana TaxID=6661 RepID=A0AA88LDM6_ARTSF|nr:hypothetical protein QYM36_002915 [Artemia franciscana]KAK2722535.1 hypothetical protein QYM36_002915 [Artemia franciscana]KAK2722536.1 hypothetical protein QYM36_002915 [Artemia franciscana]KAK2722537.1 hypothetical protein QYM36_002915 [Artemia franciscana]
MFKVGDKVFAKLKGFPHWPGRILDYSQDNKKYTLFYYGTHECGYAKEEDLSFYSENKDKFGTKKRRDLQVAIEEIETNPDISDEIEIVVPPPHSGRGRVESQRKTIKSITVKSPAGDVCEIHYDHDRPEIFKSKEEEETWEKETQENLKRLREDFESGKFQVAEWALPPNLRPKKQDKEEQKLLKLMWLKREVELLDYHVKIKEHLSVKDPNCQLAMDCLDKLLELDVAPLMLKKHPYVLDTINKLKRYVGPKSAEDKKEEILQQADSIRSKAEKLFNKLTLLFVVPEGKTFNEVFIAQIVEFQKATYAYSDERIMMLTEDPVDSR